MKIHNLEDARQARAVNAAVDAQDGRCDCCAELINDGDDVTVWTDPDGGDPKALCAGCSAEMEGA